MLSWWNDNNTESDTPLRRQPPLHTDPVLPNPSTILSNLPNPTANPSARRPTQDQDQDQQMAVDAPIVVPAPLNLAAVDDWDASSPAPTPGSGTGSGSGSGGEARKITLKMSKS